MQKLLGFIMDIISHILPSPATSSTIDHSSSSPFSMPELLHNLKKFQEALKKDEFIEQQKNSLNSQIQKALNNQPKKFFSRLFQENPLKDLSKALESPCVEQFSQDRKKKLQDLTQKAIKSTEKKCKSRGFLDQQVEKICKGFTDKARALSREIMDHGSTPQVYKPHLLLQLQQKVPHYKNHPNIILPDETKDSIISLLYHIELANADLFGGLVEHCKPNGEPLNCTIEHIAKHFVTRMRQDENNPNVLQCIYQVALKIGVANECDDKEAQNTWAKHFLDNPVQDTIHWAIAWISIIRIDERDKVTKIVEQLPSLAEQPCSLFLDHIDQLLQLYNSNPRLFQEQTEEIKEGLSTAITTYLDRFYNTYFTHLPQQDQHTWVNQIETVKNLLNQQEQSQALFKLRETLLPYIEEKEGDCNTHLLNHSLFHANDKLKQVQLDQKCSPISDEQFSSVRKPLACSIATLVAMHFMNKLNPLNNPTEKLCDDVFEKFTKLKNEEEKHKTFKQFIKEHIFQDPTIGYEKKWYVYLLTRFVYFIFFYLSNHFINSLITYCKSIAMLSQDNPAEFKGIKESFIRGANNALVTYNQACKQVKNDPEGHKHGGISTDECIERTILTQPNLTGGRTMAQDFRAMAARFLHDHALFKHGIQWPQNWSGRIIQWQKGENNNVIVKGIKYGTGTVVRIFFLFPIKLVTTTLNFIASLCIKATILAFFIIYKNLWYSIYIERLNKGIESNTFSHLLEYCAKQMTQYNTEGIKLLNFSLDSTDRLFAELAHNCVLLLQNKAHFFDTQPSSEITLLHTARDSAIENIILHGIRKGWNSMRPDQLIHSLYFLFEKANRLLSHSYAIHQLYSEEEQKKITAFLRIQEDRELTNDEMNLYVIVELGHVTSENLQSQLHTKSAQDLANNEYKDYIQNHLPDIAQKHEENARHQKQLSYDTFSGHIEKQIRTTIKQNFEPQEEQIIHSLNWVQEQFIKPAPHINSRYITQMLSLLNSKEALIDYHTNIVDQLQHHISTLNRARSQNKLAENTLAMIKKQLQQTLLQPLNEISQQFLHFRSSPTEAIDVQTHLDTLERNMQTTPYTQNFERLCNHLENPIHHQNSIAKMIKKPVYHLIEQLNHPETLTSDLYHTFYKQVVETPVIEGAFKISTDTTLITVFLARAIGEFIRSCSRHDMLVQRRQLVEEMQT